MNDSGTLKINHFYGQDFQFTFEFGFGFGFEFGFRFESTCAH